MTDMVERVARVVGECFDAGSEKIPGISIASCIDCMPCASDGADCSCAKQLARAAIAAMREPTDAQYEALSATGKVWRDLDSKTVWQTYIDAALGAKTSGD